MQTKEHQKILLEVAKNAIRYGIEHAAQAELNGSPFPAALQEQLASFVTLQIDHELRGCIGTLVAVQPLILDVHQNAYAAAFHDPRFAPLSAREFSELEIYISILSKPETIVFSSETDLIEAIRPGVDGLILQSGNYRGTFLPTVWEMLPNPREFLLALKHKAGLPSDYWSDDLQVSRYTTEIIRDQNDDRM